MWLEELVVTGILQFVNFLLCAHCCRREPSLIFTADPAAVSSGPTNEQCRLSTLGTSNCHTTADAESLSESLQTSPYDFDKTRSNWRFLSDSDQTTPTNTVPSCMQPSPEAHPSTNHHTSIQTNSTKPNLADLLSGGVNPWRSG